MEERQCCCIRIKAKPFFRNYMYLDTKGDKTIKNVLCDVKPIPFVVIEHEAEPIMENTGLVWNVIRVPIFASSFFEHWVFPQLHDRLMVIGGKAYNDVWQDFIQKFERDFGEMSPME